MSKLLDYAALQESGIRYSKAHLWRLWTAGKFPRPVKLSASRNVWLESDVDAWIKSRLAEHIQFEKKPSREKAGKKNDAMKEIRRSDSVCNHSIVYSLHRGRSRRALVQVIPDPCGLYRVKWPDTGLSDLANLARCKAAAREWAERNAVLEDRKTNAARRLKSLDNFWWSSSYIAQKAQGAA